MGATEGMTLGASDGVGVVMGSGVVEEDVDDVDVEVEVDGAHVGVVVGLPVGVRVG